jgi:glycosyltransferase involved in cell wall biosynthesis
MKLVFEGNSRPDNSYGVVNLALARGLASLGHEVYFNPWDQPLEELRTQLIARGFEPFDPGDPRQADAVVRQYWPPCFDHPGSERFIVIQPFEFGAVPIGWVHEAVEVDAIWVPSSFSKLCWVQGGMDPAKVWIVPNPLEVPEFESQERLGNRLLFVGGAIPRKGVDILIKTLDTFTDQELRRLELVVKEVGRETSYREKSLIDKLLAEYPRVAAQVTVISDSLARADLFALMSSAACLVHPYRGEGFGLPMLEAMAVGTPVVATRGGAADDFLNEANAYLVDSDLVIDDDPEISVIFGPHVGTRYWFEPKVEALSARIREALSGYDENRSSKAFEVAASYSLDNVAKCAEEAITSMELGPRDRITKSLDVVRDNGSPLIRVVAELVGLSDVHGALAVLEKNCPEDLLAVKHRLAELAGQRGDLFRGAPHRKGLAPVSLQKKPHVRSYEGSDSAAMYLGRFFPLRSRILLAGSGTAAMARFLSARGCSLTVFDADQAVRLALSRQGFDVYGFGSADDLNCLDEQAFDGAYLVNMLERVSAREMARIFGQIARLLKPESLLVVESLDFTDPAVALVKFWLDKGNLRPAPIELATDLAMRAGFEPLAGCQGSLAPAANGRAYFACRLAAVKEEPSRGELLHVAIRRGSSGFARASRELARGLSRIIDLAEADVESKPRLERDFKVVIHDIPLAWLAVPMELPIGDRTILRTTTEVRGLKPGILRALEIYDEIWTMSCFDSTLMEQAGVDRGKIRRVPPVYSQLPNPGMVADHRRSKAFLGSMLSVFKFEERKNPRALMRAFAQVASVDKRAHLVVKLSGISAGDFARWAVGTAGIEEDLFRRIRLIDRDLTDAEMSALYLDADIFILPSRGEGFGLPFLEAAAYGLAIVAPDTGGHRDFLDEESAVLIPTQWVPAGAFALPDVFSGAWWLDVDPAEIAARCAEICDNPAMALEFGQRALAAAQAHCSVDPLAEVMGTLSVLTPQR